jgi:hypothetical protein
MGRAEETQDYTSGARALPVTFVGVILGINVSSFSTPTHCRDAKTRRPRVVYDRTFSTLSRTIRGIHSRNRVLFWKSLGTGASGMAQGIERSHVECCRIDTRRNAQDAAFSSHVLDVTEYPIKSFIETALPCRARTGWLVTQSYIKPTSFGMRRS